MKITSKIYSILIAIAASMIPLTASASLACFESPENSGVTNNIGGFDSSALTQKSYKENQSPAQDLLGCFSQVAFEGPESIIGNHCGCLEAVKSSCKFEWDDGSLDISATGGAMRAWCVPFAFLAY